MVCRKFFKVKFAMQEQLLGTGDAVKAAIPGLKPSIKDVVVLCGDVPLIQESTLKNMVDGHKKNQAKVSVLATDVDDPKGYGRIVLDEQNNMICIKEEADASETEKKIKKINIYNPKQNFNNLLLITSLNFFIENLIKKNFNSGNILLGSSQPIKLIQITKIIADYFGLKSYINWKIHKKRGFYLNISRAIKKYNFKPLSTKKSILNYLKTIYPKNVK